MSEPFLGQVSIVSFAFAPRGYASCNGQLLPINQNQALFALLGTQFGGDGQTTFALPNLQGRVPVHFGINGVQIGQAAGAEAHTVTLGELPLHTHVVMGTPNQATGFGADASVLAEKPRRGKNVYADSPAAGVEQRLSDSSVSTAGSGQPHSNLQPSLVLNFVIALQGIFPSRN